MIAVDTNIVVRLLTQDDQAQYEHSLQLFEENDIFIPNTVILEIEWVLRFAYEFNPNNICNAFRSLMGLPKVHFANAELMMQVLEWHEHGLDFADALHLAQSEDCSALYTFDTKFVKRARNLSDCEVRHP